MKPAGLRPPPAEIDWRSLALARAPTSERLAMRLQRLIIDGALDVGDRLPSERELAETLGVSRASCREAILELQLKGLVDRRPGRGTTIIAGPRIEDMSMLGAALPSAKRQLLMVMDFRRVIEPQIAARSAVRATGADIQLLGELIGDFERARSQREVFELAMQFHLQVARAAHNPLFVELMEMTLGWMRASRSEPLQRRRRKRAAIDGHAAIYRAIAARDPEAAARAMETDLSNTQRIILAEGLGEADDIDEPKPAVRTRPAAARRS